MLPTMTTTIPSTILHGGISILEDKVIACKQIWSINSRLVNVVLVGRLIS